MCTPWQCSTPMSPHMYRRALDGESLISRPPLFLFRAWLHLRAARNAPLSELVDDRTARDHQPERLSTLAMLVIALPARATARREILLWKEEVVGIMRRLQNHVATFAAIAAIGCCARQAEEEADACERKRKRWMSKRVTEEDWIW